MTTFCFRHICAALIGVVLGLSTLTADQVEDLNLVRSKFFVDHATFADSTPQINRLEVYYKIYNDGLNYIKKGDKYYARYELNFVVLDDDDQQVAGQSVERTYVLDSYDLTKSNQGFLINQVALRVPPGSFRLQSKLIDHNSNEFSQIESNIESHEFHRAAGLSDIEFIQEVAAADSGSLFVKQGRATVPVVERSYDSDLQKLGFYVEVYAPGLIGKPVQLEYGIKAKRPGFEIEKSSDIIIEQPVMAADQFIDLKDLAPGDYLLRLRLKHDGKELEQREDKFVVWWSQQSLVRNDFDYAVSQLKYLLEKDEKKQLLAQPDSLREQAFEDWWKGKDPTPNTPENELREEYYRRIRYANQYFSAINREGWLTDRGNVYIRYGPPDDIESHPYDLDRKPYQIWYYFTQRRKFVFEDSRGNGDYELQYPYDGDWRRSGTLGP